MRYLTDVTSDVIKQWQDSDRWYLTDVTSEVIKRLIACTWLMRCFLSAIEECAFRPIIYYQLLSNWTVDFDLSLRDFIASVNQLSIVARINIYFFDGLLLTVLWVCAFLLVYYFTLFLIGPLGQAGLIADISLIPNWTIKASRSNCWYIPYS